MGSMSRWRVLAGMMPLLLQQAGPAWADAAPAPAAVAPANAAPAPAAPAKAAPASATPAIPPRIATADLAARPFLTGPVLSPDGLHMAARFGVKGEERLGIADMTGKSPLRMIGLAKHNDLVRYFWAGNHTLILVSGSTVPWFDDEGYATRMAAFDLTTEKFLELNNKMVGLKGDEVLWIDPDGKTLIMAFQETLEDYPRLWRMEVATNKATRISYGFDGIWDWYADSSGVVRYGFGFSDEHNWKAVYRHGPTDKFQVVAKGNDDSDMVVDAAIGLTPGSDKGFTVARDADNPFWSVYEYDFAHQGLGKVLYQVPDSDIDDWDTTADGQSLVWAMHTDDRKRIHWFDDKLAKVQADLDKAVGADRQAWIITHSRDYEILVVGLSSSDNPGSLYLYQQAQGAMQRFAKVNEHLDPNQLARTSYVHYKARDGKELAAYLTLPVGRDPKGLPLIIMPHGGPFGIRDDGSFDEEVQFYANRGYVVLQPEFRGSGSFGRAFEDSAEGQWGRAMQDDLDDGMDWLAKAGTVDPKRVCMIGSSYGGYAALWAATRNPERYRCAASFAGISDVPKWLKYSGRFDGTKHRENWRARLQGDKTFDLKTVSPLYTVDRLKVPVLIAHGETDQRVPFKQSKQYADALTAAGKVHEFVPIPEEGHGFTTAEHEKLWFDRLDAFLAKYNPAG